MAEDGSTGRCGRIRSGARRVRGIARGRYCEPVGSNAAARDLAASHSYGGFFYGSHKKTPTRSCDAGWGFGSMPGDEHSRYSCPEILSIRVNLLHPCSISMSTFRLIHFLQLSISVFPCTARFLCPWLSIMVGRAKFRYQVNQRQCVGQGLHTLPETGTGRW